jgi:2-amino-4-hydroxy-6-hydroxymethyldihydropteridine diphosphokinase
MKIYIGLGGNLGDPVISIRNALDMIGNSGLGKVVRLSSNYRTEPVGIKDQPWFVNAAAEVETGAPPEQFRKGLEKIELDLGRTGERKRDGPRPIDLDILLWGDQVIEHKDLVIPHPRMHERRFVLVPLAEIAPEAAHPVLRKTVRQLLENLDDPARVEKIS